jgi:hypothetical protein
LVLAALSLAIALAAAPAVALLTRGKRAARPRPVAPAALATARGSLEVLPFPGTPDASPRTQINFPAVTEPAQLRAVTVAGSRSGSHRGKVVALPHGRGTAFLPDQPFLAGEQVTVHAVAAGATAAAATQARFSFTIADPPGGAPGPPTWVTQKVKPPPLQSFHSRSDLRPPVVTVTTANRDTTAGDIFVAPVSAPQDGPMILDPQGHLVWFDPLGNGDWAFNFREQRYRGQPVLSWFQGHIASPGYGVGEDVIVNSSYQTVATVQAGEGYQADLHEFLITPQGTALLTAYQPQRADLSAVGGPRDGIVLDALVQEVDIASGRVLWEWHALGHIPLSASYSGKPTAGAPYDYLHINSIAVAPNGNLIISARNTWAVYEIDRRTGAIVWQLGGKSSSFKMGAGTQFEWQHDASLQPDGTITLFDNAASPTEESQSRALQIELDTRTHSATLVRAVTHSPALLATSQGNTQLLPDGNVFVGWGAQPELSEYSASGQQIFDARFPGVVQSYRAYRFDWSAQPAASPSIAVSKAAASARAGPAVESGAGNAITAYASWNGATNVAGWQLLAGPSPIHLSPLTSQASAGFETAITATTTTSELYLAVQALDSSGRVLATSNAVKSPR